MVRQWLPALFRGVIFLEVGLLALASAGAATADPPSMAPENQVKAAFLAKFAAYVNWPPAAMGAANDPIQICIIGRDPFGPVLDQMISRQHVDLHPFIVRRLGSTTGATSCHVAFLGGSATQSVGAMADGLRGKPILTVTDGALGAERGIVHFMLKEERVRFHIDDARAAQANLAISARLLSLALSVKPRTQPS